MKKIVLVALNAKYIHSNLAIYALRAYAKERGQEVTCLEFTINRQFDEILREIYLEKPDVLALSCYIWNIEFVRELIEEFKQIRPETEIWVGGPEVSYETEDFLANNPGVTGIIIGEGEETFWKLCCYWQQEFEGNESEHRNGGSEGAVESCAGCTPDGLQNYAETNDIEGITWRNSTGDVLYREKTRLLSMDELPFCYGNIEDFEHRIIYYESSRGCPFSCSYCLSSVDKHLRLRSLELVYHELQFFLDHQVPLVKFVDRTFNCNHAHACGIWKYITEHDNGFTRFHFEISADLLTEEELNLLAAMRPGLIQLEIGVQTTNPQTLGEIRRHTNLAKLATIVKRIQTFGNIHQHLDLIAGLPYEDYESFTKSFDDVYRMYGDQLQLGFLKVLKGSYMFEMAEKYGLRYRKKPPYEVLATAWISYEELLRIKTVEEMLELHYNSGQFSTTVSVLETNFDSPFRFYLDLGEFYEAGGLKDVSCSRLRRVEFLRNYAQQLDESHIELYEDALLHDLFLREKSKVRPLFAYQAPDLSKEITRILNENGYEHKFCHVERFRYPVWELHRGMSRAEVMAMKPLPEPVWVIYDYEHKQGDNATVVICSK